MKTNQPVILADGLTKKFGSFTAVYNLQFSVQKGEIFGFIGANGAGKTTAIRMLTGLLQPTSGDALVAGYSVGKQPDQVKKRIGYMSQRFSLYEDLTVSENIRFFGGIYGLSNREIQEQSANMLNQLGMHAVAGHYVRSLPLGWKQKIAFSAALVHNPAIVFLDEPTGGVDPVTRRQFWEMIYQKASEGTTIFVTTHYMDEAEYCDRVSIMVDGRIDALGTPSELKSTFNSSSMDDVFVHLARPGGGV